MGNVQRRLFEDLILTVTLGHTIVFTVVDILDATSLQMRRGLAAKGHAQSHSAGEGLSPDSSAGPQPWCCPVHLAFSLWGRGRGGEECPQGVKIGS